MDNKKYAMVVVETYQQVYLFYHLPYQSHADYLETFKAYLKVREAHNGVPSRPGCSRATRETQQNQRDCKLITEDIYQYQCKVEVPDLSIPEWGG